MISHTLMNKTIRLCIIVTESEVLNETLRLKRYFFLLSVLFCIYLDMRNNGEEIHLKPKFKFLILYISCY